MDTYVISEASDFFIENSFYLELFTFLWTNMLSFELVIRVFFGTSDSFESNCCNLYN